MKGQILRDILEGFLKDNDQTLEIASLKYG